MPTHAPDDIIERHPIEGAHPRTTLDAATNEGDVQRFINIARITGTGSFALKDATKVGIERLCETLGHMRAQLAIALSVEVPAAPRASFPSSWVP